jgi:hypothetical protein
MAVFAPAKAKAKAINRRGMITSLFGSSGVDWTRKNAIL